MTKNYQCYFKSTLNDSNVIPGFREKVFINPVPKIFTLCEDEGEGEKEEEERRGGKGGREEGEEKEEKKEEKRRRRKKRKMDFKDTAPKRTK